MRKNKGCRRSIKGYGESLTKNSIKLNLKYSKE